jgi:hypothetical protein
MNRIIVLNKLKDLNRIMKDVWLVYEGCLACYDNDTLTCYVRIVVALAMLVARQGDMPTNAITLVHSEPLQLVKYTVKTMYYRISDGNYHDTIFAPLFPKSQRSGALPSVRSSLLALLLQTIDRIIPHRTNCGPFTGARPHHARITDAVVNDTTNVVHTCFS